MSKSAAVAATFAADRRLVILRLLMETGAGINTSALEKAVYQFHRTVDRDMIRDDARWLSGRGLVELEELTADLWVVSITTKGERVARGEIRVEGVDRPTRA